MYKLWSNTAVDLVSFSLQRSGSEDIAADTKLRRHEHISSVHVTAKIRENERPKEGRWADVRTSVEMESNITYVDFFAKEKKLHNEF